MIGLTAPILKELLRYEPETGIFVWLEVKPVNGAAKRRNRLFAGRECGAVDDRGYLRIRVLGTKYRAHRLAWLYVFGAWPEGEIDHKNCDRLDNRLVNLREASRSDNMRNVALQKNNKSGAKGIWQTPSGTWRCVVNHRHVGNFSSLQEAVVVRTKYIADKHGEFARQF